MIVIPNWLKNENPVKAEFCELINFALEGNPNMTLSEFAQILNFENIKESYLRIQEAERKQFERDS